MAAAPAAAYPPGMSDVPRDLIPTMLLAIRADIAEGRHAGPSRRADRPGGDAGPIGRRPSLVEA